MAFFKFRKTAEEPVAAPPASSIDDLRKSARRRLIGAAVLVLAALIAFPLLFDSQPRPVAVDIPISIPDRDKVKPLVTPAPASEALTAPPGPATSTNHTSTVASTQTPTTPSATTAGVTPAPGPALPASSLAPDPKASATKPATPTPATSAISATGTATVAPGSAKPGDEARARALLEGRQDPAKSASGKASAPEQIRIVLQVGAFADVAKARDVRRKLEKSGLKTYTQVVETSEGKRIRVRLGPYTERGRADKDAEKIKALDLPVTYLTL